MNNNESQWWNDKKYWFDDPMLTGSVLPDLNAIIAESERRKVKEIREAVLRLDCFDPVHDNKRDEILSLDCLKDE